MLKRLFFLTMIVSGFAVTLPARVEAQADILLRLRSGSPLGDRVRVDSAGGLIAMGSLGIGIIPFSGNGSRMMWYPFKAAFRAGTVDNSAGTWDDANVGFYSFATGLNSLSSGTGSFAGGYNTNADGQGAVAIGYRSTADADYSVAIGQRASANGHQGAIVFSDASTTDSVEASANNQFSLRAAGGVRLYTNATTTTGISLNAGGSSWVVISDRNRKENFLDVNLEDVLARIRQLPISTWRYTGEEDRSVRHIGPMAQDWHALFSFSPDDKTINMSDLDGVNLAGVKALEARTGEQSIRIQKLEEELRALKAEMASLREMMKK